jgi:5-methylcytosine-specific restriction endonuclease McrA
MAKEITVACVACGGQFRYVHRTGVPPRRCEPCKVKHVAELWRASYRRNADTARLRAREYWRANHSRSRTKACATCGTEFTYAVVRGRRRFHCDPCTEMMRRECKGRYRESHREELRVAGREYAVGRYQRQRDRLLREAAERRKVRRLALYKRDGGRCHICGGLVSWDEFEVDHIFPISRGGTSAQENLGTSHRECNRRKGARVLEEVTAVG